VRDFGFGADFCAEEDPGGQGWQLNAEKIGEKIQAAGAGTAGPHSRPDFRDSTSPG